MNSAKISDMKFALFCKKMSCLIDFRNNLAEEWRLIRPDPQDVPESATCSEELFGAIDKLLAAEAKHLVSLYDGKQDSQDTAHNPICAKSTAFTTSPITSNAAEPTG